MKKALLLILILQSFTLVLLAQTNKSPAGESVFYYYKGQKVYFNVTYKKIVVGFAEGHSINEIKTFLTVQSKAPADSIKTTALKNQYLLKPGKIANEETGKSIAL